MYILSQLVSQGGMRSDLSLHLIRANAKNPVVSRIELNPSYLDSNRYFPSRQSAMPRRFLLLFLCVFLPGLEETSSVRY